MNINWGFNLGHRYYDTTILDSVEVDKSFILSPLAQDIFTSRKNVIFSKCPAHTGYLRNMFVFRSPIDIHLHLEITEEYKKVYSNNLDQYALEQLIDTRFLEPSEKGNSPYPLLGIDLLNCFYTDTSVEMEMLPAYLHYNNFTQNHVVVPGSYNIGKWVRPAELVFESRSNNIEINITKGDALVYFKFRTEEAVKLTEVDFPWDEIKKCNTIRQHNPFRPLSDRYKSYLEISKQQ